MKKGFLRPVATIICMAICAGAAAINSNDIETGTSSRGASIETFYVEIKGPGGQVYTDPKAESGRHHTIPANRLHPRRRGDQNGQSARPSARSENIGFFTYSGFPADYNVNKTAATLPLEPGQTIFDLARKTKDVKVSVNQQVASIFRKNLKCFNDGSLDSVVPGCMFKIPSAQQAAAEDKELAKKLYAQRGVSKSEFQYAKTNCPSGLCGQPSTDRADTSVPDESKQETAKVQQNTLTLENDSKDAGVHYYQGDKKQDDGSDRGKEVKPTETTVILVDDHGNKTTPEELVAANQRKVSDKTTTSGASLSFNGDNVAGKNSKGEIIDEVSKEVSKEVSRRMDGKFDDINSRIATSNSDISNISREVSELRAQNAALMQQMSRLNDLLEKRENETSEVKAESEVPLSLIAGAGIIIMILLIIVTYLSFRVRRKLSSEMETSVDDELEETGDFDHLMSLDPIAMVPTDGESPNFDAAPSSGADLNSESLGIDLNRASDEKPRDKNSDNSFIIADDSSASTIDLDEETFQKADIGSTDVVTEDPSNREQVDISQNDDLVPKDLNTELDESDFLESMPKGKSSVDLESNLTTRDIDEIISEASGVIEEDSPLAKASGMKTGSGAAQNATDDDIDAILASMGDSSGGNENASSDDIDAVISANSRVSSETADDSVKNPNTGDKSDEKASNDDIDAILASMGGDSKESKPAAEEKASDDDIDAILASAGVNLNESKPAAEEKASDDDIDAILASMGGDSKESKPAAEEKASDDDIDAILASMGGDSKESKPAAEEKASDDDIDAILSAAGGGDSKPAADEKASDDDIDAILASAGAAKDGSAAVNDEKMSSDDIDDILNSISSTAESDPVVPAAVSESETVKVENETVDADDIDALLAQSVPVEPPPELSDSDAKDSISLAKAYLSIDDKNSARDTLLDVIKRAGPEYRQEAEQMLSKI